MAQGLPPHDSRRHNWPVQAEKAYNKILEQTRETGTLRRK